MVMGSLKWFNQRGFGVIIDNEGQDIFFHIRNSNALRGKESSLVEGAMVDFDRRPSSQKGKEGTFEAYNVRLRGTPSPRQVSPAPEGLQAQPTIAHFHNPYTFVPTPPRGPIASDQFAGDYDPVTHGLTHASLQPELWTGHLPIQLTTVTPLLLPDVGDKERKATEHQTYDMLNALPESSLRGMLRSAYEIITNSRYACFRNSDRLAYRMETQEAITLIPAIIEAGESPGKLAARLYLGKSRPTARGPDGPMYAAMLTLYGDSPPRSRYEQEPKTGDAVWAEIVLCEHEVYDQDRRTRQWAWEPNYTFWKVVHVWPRTSETSPPAMTGGTPWFTCKPRTSDRRRTYYAPVTPEDRRIVEGYVLITNQNINNKHDERVFFDPESRTFDVIKLQEPWRMRIQSYREAHPEQEIFARRIDSEHTAQPWDKIGNTPGKTAWSPHLYHDGEHNDRWHRTVHDARYLQPGDMVYARCTFNAKGDIEAIIDLFPVMISRELYDDSPEALLDASLRPAPRRDQLSPADRLFGWVAQNAEAHEGAAYKGRIRIICEDGPRPEIVKRFPDRALPLAILGQPKPAQGRFYVAKDQDGTPHNRGGQKPDRGYYQPNALRGRKQYWHHVGLEAEQAPAYWQPSTKDRTQQQRNGRYQEYRRPNDNNDAPQTDSQNRSITSWIPPHTVFHVTLHVQNLQHAEVGALLWLLSLPKKHYFRLGYGKPLGFGSVRLEIDQERLITGNLPLGTGKDWQHYYSSLSAAITATLDEHWQQECMQTFKASMVAAYDPLPHAREPSGTPQRLSSFASLNVAQFTTSSAGRFHLEAERFDNLPFIKGFLQVLRGPHDGAPIHYPRAQVQPDRSGENFRWFVSNERRGKQHALPAVTATEGLPYQP